MKNSQIVPNVGGKCVFLILRKKEYIISEIYALLKKIHFDWSVKYGEL